MPSLLLQGTVANVLHVPARTDKKKTGEVFPAKDQVQIMSENVLQNGEKRLELVTLTTDNPEAYKSLMGRPVRVPVGVIGAVQLYAVRGQFFAHDWGRYLRKRMPPRMRAKAPICLIHRTKVRQPVTARLCGHVITA